MIADVVFDLPLRHPFTYLVPPGLTLARGQRVKAPLHGRARVGVVVDLREGEAAGLKPILDLAEPVPVLSPSMLRLAGWAAAESLSTLGSTVAAMLPPLGRRAPAESVAPPFETLAPEPTAPELWVAATREAELAEDLGRAKGSALVVAPDIETAKRWAERLDAARLDSGAPEAARRAAWYGVARGRSRIAVGTRSALLVPLPPPSTLVLLDEHDAAHKPPGAPRMHSRELLLERARLDGSRLLLLSATPSVESWWRSEQGQILRREPTLDAWPEVVTADTRGVLRNHPLTLPLTRAIEEAGRRGRQVVLVLTRGASALGCDECGALLRCPDCGVALALSRAAASLSCRLCARREPLPEGCPSCGGHRLSAVGWSGERVESSVRKRFPRLTVERVEGPRTKPPRVDPRAHVVIGSAALLRTLPRGRLACVGFVALDGLLRVPDFRAGERVFQSLWAAAEAVEPAGRVIVQTLHPEHYAIRAVREQDRGHFYAQEIRFRSELGYPPFRRLCAVTATGESEAGARALVAECAAALAGIAGLAVYPAAPRGAPAAKRARWSFVVKGPAELPRLIGEPLRPFLERRRRRAGVVEVEMDPATWT